MENSFMINLKINFNNNTFGNIYGLVFSERQEMN